MPDEIIKEIWKIKDRMADECGCDVKALVVRLRTKKLVGNQRLVDLRTMKHIAETGAQADRQEQNPL